MTLAPFMKQNSAFNNSMKDGNWQMCLCYLLPHENINISSEAYTLINDLCMRQLGNILADTMSVLSMEETKCVLTFPSCLELLQAFCFLKGASIISHNFRPNYNWQVPKYIGKAKTCIFFRACAKIKCCYWNCTTTKCFLKTHIHP